MEIRKSEKKDLEIILSLYEAARKFMKENGNPEQWGDTYPEEELIIQDIEERNSYVCTEEGKIIGTFYFKEGEDKTYKKIVNGDWLNDEVYGVVHRITAMENKKGAASYCLKWCFGQCGNIRIDTYKDNIPMQKMLEKNGFKKCGIIYLENGAERIAYQKYEQK